MGEKAREKGDKGNRFIKGTEGDGGLAVIGSSENHEDKGENEAGSLEKQRGASLKHGIGLTRGGSLGGGLSGEQRRRETTGTENLCCK